MTAGRGKSAGLRTETGAGVFIFERFIPESLALKAPAEGGAA
jgi:hypothetical protein